ncbi:uncharacterized protein [Nicotiana tomentosiformis]|uniref:uncharacterized protein n=1 Tax=Nicotiana tomentosiformis TaxID=4098 RepID=UPI00388C40DC
MAPSETSKIRFHDYDKCNELQNIIEQDLKDMRKIFDELEKIKQEKKNWETQLDEHTNLKNEKKEWDILLEEYHVENDLLQEENAELCKQINNLYKSFRHHFDRPNKGIHFLNNSKLTEKGSTSRRPTSNKSIQEIFKSIKISSDASQLLPNPKRRKMSNSPNVLLDTSDIPNFNLCSFSLGSTQKTGLEDEQKEKIRIRKEKRKEEKRKMEEKKSKSKRKRAVKKQVIEKVVDYEEEVEIE